MGRPKGSRSKPKPRPDNPPADNMPLPPIAAAGGAVSPSDDVLGVERENVCKKWGDAAEGAEDIKPPPTSSLKKRVIIIGLMIILLGILIKLFMINPILGIVVLGIILTVFCTSYLLPYHKFP